MATPTHQQATSQQGLNRHGHALAKLGICVLAAVLLAAGLAVPTPAFLATETADAWHPPAYPPPPRVWAKYRSSVPSDARKIQWQACAMTGAEETMAWGGINYWETLYGRNIDSQKMADGCTTNYDLVVSWLDSEDMEDTCGVPAHACFDPYAYNQVTEGGVQKILVFKSAIWFNIETYPLLVTDAQRIHVFEHEFGHGMALDEHSSCGLSVMSQWQCEDHVKVGAFPNDLCSPDYYLGHTPWRCT